ncbi:hypothetical protein ABZ935_39740 [Streptomyces coeruleorubidus]
MCVGRFATMILVALSANTSFGGLPVLLKLLVRDNYAPHVFALKADRQVHRHGVLALAIVSAALLVFSGGDTNTLGPLFAIGVFVGSTIAQVGMVRHWRVERGRGEIPGGRLAVEARAHMHALERSWAEWDPGVPLVRLSSERRGLGRPIAAYVRGVAAAEPDTRVTLLIPETEPERLWQRLLQNQRGAVVAHAVRRQTDAVICRLRFRLL